MLMHAEPISIDLLISKSKLLFHSKLNENVCNPWYEKIRIHNTYVLILPQILKKFLNPFCFACALGLLPCLHKAK